MALDMYKVQLRSNGIVIFPDLRGMLHDRHNLHHEEKKGYSGIMTPTTRKRISCATDIMVQRNPRKRIYNPISETEHDFQLNFTTLTIPNYKMVSARAGYDKLLSKYLRYMKDKYSMREYLWKIELQQNGMPHYHLLMNDFVPWQVIRWKWNNLLKNEGLLNGFAKKYGHFNPPSTEIKSVEKMMDAQRYLTKELCKSTFCTVVSGDPVINVRWNKESKIYEGFMYEDIVNECVAPVSWSQDLECIEYPSIGNRLVEAKVDGKLWDCSEVLKTGRFTATLDKKTNDLIYAAKWRGQLDLEKNEFCEIARTLNPQRYISPEINKAYQSFIKQTIINHGKRKSKNVQADQPSSEDNRQYNDNVPF